MNHLKYLIVFSFFMLVTSCANEPKEVNVSKALKQFSTAMNGQWALQPEEKSLEIWTPMEEGSVIGRGLAISAENDTTITEVYFLEPVNDTLRLQVQPGGVGVGQEINYYLTAHGKNKFVFENPNHNFPQKMTYSVYKNGYEVLLEGEIGGIHQQADLNYKKSQ